MPKKSIKSDLFDDLSGGLMMVILFSLIVGGEAHGQHLTHLEKQIGLYQVVSSECEVPMGDYNPCDTTLFMEVVKGKFVVDSALAYVYWSGDPNVDPELQFEAHAISGGAVVDDAQRLWLRRNASTQAFFQLRRGKVTDYVAIHWPNDERRMRRIHYRLKPVSRADLSTVSLKYPRPD